MIPIPATELPPRRVTLGPDQIRAVFKTATSQVGYVVGLFRLIYGGDWDRIGRIDGHPRCSEELSKFVFDLAIQWDRVNCRNVVAGGAWMNYGWSSRGAGTTGWEVTTAPATVLLEAY